MGFYRKKPVIIEAVKFDPLEKHKTELPDGVLGIPSPNADNWAYQGCQFYINTLEGKMNVRPGDWIIKGVKGEYYACRSDIFELTYERVDTAFHYSNGNTLVTPI